MDDFFVLKLNLEKQETWRYPARVLSRQPDSILIEAEFNRDDLPFHGILFKRGDRFIEIYYSKRWYNIYEIHDRDDNQLKGWYCNISLPAELKEHQIAYVDLALDLLVYPDGRQLVLDEDEFAVLPLDEEVRASSRRAIVELQQIFRSMPDISLENGRYPK